MSILAFIRLGRYQFLVGGFLLHGLGVAMARYEGAAIQWEALLWGQIAITLAQLMAAYANEYFDLEADRVNLTPTAWSGGSRMLPDGMVKPEIALVTALVLGLVSLIAALVLALIVTPGFLTLGLLLLAILLAWGYSAPPLHLHSRGMGELGVATVVTALTPIIGYYLQAGRVSHIALLAVIPLCCLQFAMLLIIEFPDATADAAVGKRTLVVRLGAARASHLCIGAIVAAYAMLPFLALAGLPVWVAAAIYLSVPVAIWQVWRMWQRDWADPTRWNILSFVSVALLIGVASAECLAFVGLELGLLGSLP